MSQARMRRGVSTLPILALAAAGILSPTIALAQQAEPVAEVVVTATKRDTKLVSTPMAITVLDLATLRERGADNAADLIQLVPGLTSVDNGPGNKRYALRGLQSAGEPEVALYYDEIPISGIPGSSLDTGASQPDLKLWDVERIEVLRGPQGTLYGNGSIGGAIRILSRRPDLSVFSAEVEGEAGATQGGGPSGALSGLINIPLVPGKLAVRLDAYTRDEGGWIDGLRTPGIAVPQIVGKDLNFEHTSGGRASAQFQPISNWTLTAIGYFQRLDTGATFETYPTFATPDDRYVTKAFVHTPWRDESWMANLISDLDLGWSDALVTASYQKRSVDQNLDTTRFLLSMFGCTEFTWAQSCTGPPDIPAVSNVLESVEAWSTEARLTSKGHGRIEWTLGAFIQDAHTDRFGQVAVADPQGFIQFAPGTDLAQNRLFARSNVDTFDQDAVFGEATATLVAGLKATVGLRWFHSDRSDEQTIEQQFFPGQPVGSEPRQQFSESAVFKKFELSYDLGARGLLYAQAAQGFRAGGPNFPGGFTLTAPPYRADSAWDFEAGWKLNFAARGLYWEGDIFDVEWSNVQQLVPTALFSYIVNGGRARSSGFETQLDWTPFSGLTLTYGVTYNDAHLVGPQPIASDPTQQLEAGDRLANVPNWTVNAGVGYHRTLIAGYQAGAGLDLQYQSDRTSLVAAQNPAFFIIPGSTLVNGRLSLEHGPWRLALRVSNLLDSFAPVSGVALDSNLIKTITAARPRTVSVSLDVRY